MMTALVNQLKSISPQTGRGKQPELDEV